MLGDSSNTVLAPATTSTTSRGGGSGGSNDVPPPRPSLTVSEVGHHNNNNNSGGEDDSKGGGDGDRSFGGNRWPRQETLALLKIRSDMDVAFRDASVKGPLWEEVSRKLAELGYNRSAKKCKEKFENVYKYHKRTKDGRTGKQEGKTYRFFDQLEAFENHSSSVLSLPPPLPPQLQPQQPPQQSKAHQAPMVTTTIPSMPVANPTSPHIGVSHISTVPSATTTTATSNTIATTMSHGSAAAQTTNLTIPSFPPTNPTTLTPSSQATNPTINPSHQPNIPASFPSFSPDLISNSTSSSTSSDMEIQGRRKRKRKWKDFFERLMMEVVQKQEEMQKKFLEAIEKREHERMVREESWKMQEMTRINREREILAQERSIAAAKDAAVMAFLQKLSEQQNPGGQVQLRDNPPQSQPPTRQPQPQPQSQPPQQAVAVAQTSTIAPAPAPTPPQLAMVVAATPLSQPQPVTSLDTLKSDDGDQNFMAGASSSRWPKIEVQALIKLRTNLDSKYQENGPKGPLWEDISAGMRKLGYNRNAKRCKEKWENINKYFKKVKESNKKRPEDSKTCPYFHQLDALYKEKNKHDVVGSSNLQLKPENTLPLMVTPEQQWPPPQHEHRPDSVMEDLESENLQEDDDRDNDDDDEEEAGGYEIVANKAAAASMSTAE